jgi:hypothetical protein
MPSIPSPLYRIATKQGTDHPHRSDRHFTLRVRERESHSGRSRGQSACRWHVPCRPAVLSGPSTARSAQDSRQPISSSHPCTMSRAGLDTDSAPRVKPLCLRHPSTPSHTHCGLDTDGWLAIGCSMARRKDAPRAANTRDTQRDRRQVGRQERRSGEDAHGETW